MIHLSRDQRQPDLENGSETERLFSVACGYIYAYGMITDYNLYPEEHLLRLLAQDYIAGDSFKQTVCIK
jgi:hypothetical protein